MSSCAASSPVISCGCGDNASMRNQEQAASCMLAFEGNKLTYLRNKETELDWPRVILGESRYFRVRCNVVFLEPRDASTPLLGGLGLGLSYKNGLAYISDKMEENYQQVD